MSGVQAIASLTRIGLPRQPLPEPVFVPTEAPPRRVSAPAVEFLYHLTQLGRPARRPPISRLMARLVELDVHLWSEEGRLRFSAPPGALTAELKSELSERKAEVVAFLDRARALADSGPPPLRLASREGHDGGIPLSFGQETLWFLDQIEPGSPFYNMPVALRLTGPLDAGALARSLEEVVRRYEILRTTFPTVDGKPVQAIHPQGQTTLRVVDLRGLPLESRESEARALSAAEARRPFDLGRGPLMRATLLRLETEEQMLLLTLHHTVFDGTSIPTLYSDLAALYAGHPVSEPAFQYADFAVWQRDWLRGEALDDLLSWWRRKLAAPLTLLQLPTDRPRPAVQRFHGGIRRARVLSAAAAESLRDLGRREGATLFATLLAAFEVLLHRHSGQDDLLVGTDADIRDRAELDGMPGFFVNQLVLRTDASGDPTFRTLLGRVRDTALEAYAHRALPFEKLVADLRPERDLSRNPLFQVSFGLHRGLARQLELPGLTARSASVETGRVQFDLSLVLTELQDGFEASLEYDSDLFDGTTAQGMLERLGVLLEGISSHPDLPIAELPLLTEIERHQVRAEWNDADDADDAESHRDRRDLPSRIAAQDPDAVAVTCGGESLTYGQLRERVSRMAGELSTLGVGPETVVALLAERGIDFLTAMLAVMEAGGAYLPLDPMHPAERHRQILARSRAPLVVASRELAAVPDHPRVAILEDLSGGRPLGSVEGGRLAYVIYTSGSTGLPKGAMVEREGMLNHLDAKLLDLRLTAADVVAQTASQCFDISVWQLLAPLVCGGRVHVVADDVVRDPLRLLAEVEEQGITVLEIVPSLLRALLDRIEGSRPPLRSLRWLILTGEALPPDLCRRWLRLYPEIPLLNAYGPTECSDDVTHHRIAQAPGEGDAHVPIGRPILNARLHLLDPGFRPVPPGVVGALHVAGPVVGRGYLHDPARTAEAFLPDPFTNRPGARLYATGDLARQLPDGTLQFLGRVDHQVKIRGFRLELGEIEALLRRHPDVREAVVVALDSEVGKRLVAYVAPSEALTPRPPLPLLPSTPSPGEGETYFRVTPPSPGEGGSGERERGVRGGEGLRAWLVENLPEYAVPSAFVFLDRLPLNANGKIDRKALPRPEAERPAAGFAAPRNPIEETLAAIWARVLGVERVGIHDGFFELGGDSILSIQIAARASQAGLPLSPRHLFQHKTVAELASVAGSLRPVTAEQGPVTGPVPLTPIQRWFFELDLPERHHWNQALLLETRPDLDARVLEEALRHLLAHHDALRLRYEPEQVCVAPVAPGGDVPFLHVSLSGLPADLEPLAAQAQASLDLVHGPLLRAVLFDPGTGEAGRLLIVVHHLAVDAVSWRILLEDLLTATTQLRRGEPVRLPAKTTSFRAWAETLAAARPEDREYWMSRDWHRAAPLPLDCPESVDDEASSETFSVSLDAGETRALLREVPEAYGTRIDDALLTALARAFERWTGSPALLVDLEGHGRDEEIAENLDLSRTVGWFTNLYPVLLELPPGGSPGDALKAVKEQLRAVPRQGLGFGLLRSAGDLAAIPRPEVVFNYLGQLDAVFAEPSAFALADESSGSPRSPRSRRAHRLEVNGYVLDGCLRINWIYGGRVLRRATVEELARSFAAALREIVAHCQSPETGGYTPSDFSLMDFSQAELDDLLSDMSELAAEEEA